jgi:hypothetical protein
MKVKFTQKPKGRSYKVGDIVEFKTEVEMTYARKYIDRGWAVEYKGTDRAAAPEPQLESPPAPPPAAAPAQDSQASAA